MTIQSVVRWKGRLSPRSFDGYYSFFYRFLIYSRKTPESLLQWAKETPDEILDSLQQYVAEKGGSRYALVEN